MRSYLTRALGLLALIYIAAFVTRHYGWYNTYWFTDVLLHIASGFMFGYFWLWLTRKTVFESRFVFFLSLVAFGVLGSFLWECWEYWGYLVKPSFTRFYTAELGDTLEDIGSGLLGAALLAMVKLREWKVLKAK